jgi:hypothetical protein
VDPLAVGRGIDPHQVGDLLVAERLRVPDQGHGGGEALQVPGEGADVRLVEVVHVEDQAALGVHVRAEVLGVEVAVDPHPARAVVEVGPAVLLALQVGVEQGGRAAVEREGGGRHLPELDPEGRGVRREQLAERRAEDGEDLLAALLSRGLRDRHRWVPPGTGWCGT